MKRSFWFEGKHFQGSSTALVLCCCCFFNGFLFPFSGIFNDGTELRISNIRHEDIGDYTCIARNGEGQISHTARVIIAGS